MFLGCKSVNIADRQNCKAYYVKITSYEEAINNDDLSGLERINIVQKYTEIKAKFIAAQEHSHWFISMRWFYENEFDKMNEKLKEEGIEIYG